MFLTLQELLRQAWLRRPNLRESTLENKTGIESQRWMMVREVLAETLRQPEQERATYLKSRVMDPEMRSEVEQLLGLEGQAQEMFAVTGWRDRMPELPAFEEVVSGAVFGPYRVLRELGRGGMGAVYLAERADGTHSQRVAIKLLQQQISSPEMERRFRSERQILAMLNHPGVARLLDGGVTPGGKRSGWTSALHPDEECNN